MSLNARYAPLHAYRLLSRIMVVRTRCIALYIDAFLLDFAYLPGDTNFFSVLGQSRITAVDLRDIKAVERRRSRIKII